MINSVTQIGVDITLNCVPVNREMILTVDEAKRVERFYEKKGEKVQR